MTERTRPLPPPAARGAWLAATALLVVVYLEAFLWTVTRVFVLNFSTAGPNATAGLVLLLVSGWTLAAIGRLEVDGATWAVTAAGLLAVGFAVSLVDAAPVAGLGAALLATAATPLLAAAVVRLRERVVVGVAAGVLLWVGTRVSLATASPYATSSGQAAYGVFVLVAAGLAAGLALRDAVPPAAFDRVGGAVAPLGALLVVAATYLASPSAVSRWALRSYEATVVAVVVGLAAGLVVVYARPVPTATGVVAWAGVHLLAVGAVLYGSGPATTAALGFAWAAATVLLAAGSRPGPAATGTGAGPLLAVQVAAIGALFGYVGAVNWPFMPAPLDATRGLATEFLLGLHALVPLSVLATIPGGESPSSRSPSGSRRSLLGALAAGAVPLVALLDADGDPVPVPEGSGRDRIRVMAYNVHLFFGEGEESGYTLGALRSVIEESEADVVAVSESDGCRPLSGNVDGLRWLGRRLDYHVAFGAPTRDGSEGVGLLSRWPIEDVRVVELPVVRSPTRLAVAATVRAPTGLVPVVATHFMTEKPGDVRAEQAQRVVDLASGHERAVVLGDFNVEPDPAAPAFRTLNDSLTDAWTAADRRRGGPDTWSAAAPRKRIDYVWLRGEWTVHEAAVTGSPRASDHLAVLAEIEPE